MKSDQHFNPNSTYFNTHISKVYYIMQDIKLMRISLQYYGKSTVQKSYIFTFIKKILAMALHSFRSLQDLGVMSEKTGNKNVFCNRDFVLQCSSKILCPPVAKCYDWRYVHMYIKHTASVKKLYPARPDQHFIDTSNVIISSCPSK